MSGSFLGIAVELLVAALLAVTIGYCAILNRRLGRLRADEAALKDMVLELVKASETAERAVEQYRRIASECDSDLAEKLKDAQHFSRFLTHEIERGEAVLTRLSRLGEMVRARRAAAAAGRAPDAASAFEADEDDVAPAEPVEQADSNLRAMRNAA